MIQCPKCNQTLPEWAKTCQFCGTVVSDVPRYEHADPVDDEPSSYRPIGAPPAKWVLVAYYVVAAWWILTGLWGVVESLIAAGRNPEYASFMVVGLFFGAAKALLGVGLALQLRFVQGIVNVIAYLNIAATVLCGGMAFPMWVVTPYGWVNIVRSLFDIGVAVMLIYLIGEMDTKPAN